MTRGAVAKARFLWHCGGMKFLCIAVLLFAGLVSTARAQSEADDKYIAIYGIIQQADNLATMGDPGEALAAFGDAQRQLQAFQKEFPDWNPNIVSFRLDHLADRMAELKSRAAMVTSAKKAVQAMTNAPAMTPPPAAPETPAELDSLRTQLQVAQAANEIWQAKLKEALSVQPAAVDPRELEKAQEKIRSLMKQIDLLNASGGGPTNAVPPVTQFVTNTVTVYVTNTPAVVATNLPEVFATNTAPVVVTNYVRVLVEDTNALEMARLDHAAAVRNYNDEHDRAEQLAAQLQKLLENAAATNAVATNPAAAGDAVPAGLRAENDRLKNELAALRAAPPAATGDTASAAQLRQAQALIATLRSEAEIAALEKVALQNRLQSALAAANAGGKPVDNSAQLSALNAEVSVLRSRLAADEASPAPYTPEELALFNAVVTPPTNPDGEKKPISEMPAGTAELVASAQAHFAAQQFDAAEADYLKILDRDQNNGIALANLATIELQEGKLDDADKHIRAALVQSPNDAYNLSTLGYLKFRQEKYDDALNALSRAAQLDPNNPEIQNYLGVTLSHQGQRKAAEAALRRAIGLNPNYAPAHNNLAVIYLNQTPPLPDLARWHYQKALAAGQPRNADLEKMLADKGAPVTP